MYGAIIRNFINSIKPCGNILERFAQIKQIIRNILLRYLVRLCVQPKQSPEFSRGFLFVSSFDVPCIAAQLTGIIA